MSAEVTAEILRELSTCACFQLRKAARVITRFYDYHLAALELRSTQFAVLAAIAGRDGEATVSAIASWLGMDHSTLVRNLRPLREAGFITSKRGRDRRTRVLSLTTVGRERLAAGVPLWRRAQDEFLAFVGTGRWGEAAAGLRVVSALPAPETSACSAAERAVPD